MAMAQSSSSSSNCCVVGPQFWVPYAVSLTIVKKLTGNYSVVDEDGDIVFKVKPALLSIRQRHILYDDSNNALLSMQPKIMTTSSTWKVFRGDSDDPRQLLFVMDKSPDRASDYDVSLAGNEKQFKIKTSWLSGSYKVFDGGNTIANMQRKLTVQSLFLGLDNLVVNVNPNVDYAFIVALVIMLNSMVSAITKKAGQLID